MIAKAVPLRNQRLRKGAYDKTLNLEVYHLQRLPSVVQLFVPAWKKPEKNSVGDYNLYVQKDTVWFRTIAAPVIVNVFSR